MDRNIVFGIDFNYFVVCSEEILNEELFGMYYESVLKW